MYLTEHLSVDKSWKPYQHSILISTKSAIEVSEYLLTQKNFDYVLLARFTQDCVENIFSIIRSSQCKPNALQFKSLLKKHFLTQYMPNIDHSNYNIDDGHHLKVILEDIKKKQNSIIGNFSTKCKFKQHRNDRNKP